jgi:DNA-binding transcriptional ArsR family regulator
MDAFEAIADPVRRDIAVLLSAAPLTAGDVARAFAHISRPAVSRHLRVLREAGIVVAEPRGRERYHRADPNGLAPVTGWLAGIRPQPWTNALDALDTEVRRTRRTATRARPTAAHHSQEHIA